MKLAVGLAVVNALIVVLVWLTSGFGAAAEVGIGTVLLFGIAILVVRLVHVGRQALAAAEEQRRTASEKDELTAVLQYLVPRMADLIQEIGHYERALPALMEHPIRPLRERRTIRMEIGETSDEDNGAEQWETESIDNDEPVRWHGFAIGVEGDLVPVKHTVRQLKLVEAYEMYRERKHPLNVLSIGSHRGKIWGFVGFDTPIRAGQRRRWWVRYVWPGMWGELRKRGTDRYSLDLTEEEAGQGVVWTEVVVRFVFPSTASGATVTCSEPSVFQVESNDEGDGRRSISFRARCPAPAVYHWRLSVESLDGYWPGRTAAEIDRPVVERPRAVDASLVNMIGRLHRLLLGRGGIPTRQTIP